MAVNLAVFDPAGGPEQMAAARTCEHGNVSTFRIAAKILVYVPLMAFGALQRADVKTAVHPMPFMRPLSVLIAVLKFEAGRAEIEPQMLSS